MVASTNAASRLSIVAGLFRSNVYTARLGLPREISREILKFLLKRQTGRGQQPSAQLLSGLHQRDARAAFSSRARRFEARGTAAHHQHVLAD